MYMPHEFLYDGHQRYLEVIEIGARGEVLAETADEVAELSYWQRIRRFATECRKIVIRVERTPPTESLY